VAVKISIFQYTQKKAENVKPIYETGFEVCSSYIRF